MSEEKILEQFRERDERVLERVSAIYGHYCRSVARNILGVGTEADDCVTDAYMHAWGHIPPDKPKSLLAYLARITRNLAIDLYRRTRAKKRFSGIDVLLSEIEEMLPDTSVAGDPTEGIALTDALNAFLEELPLQKLLLLILLHP